MLAGNVAFVTGGARGIGAAICRRAAAHGAAVAVNYLRSRARAEALVAEIRRDGGRAIAVGADITEADEGRAALARAASELGTVDVLVHNAWPGWQGGRFEDLAWPDFQRYVDGLLRPAVELTQAALPGMRERRRGRIVFLGSTSMYELNEEHTPYIASKGALLALARGMARDLGPFGVTVNVVSPSLVWTSDAPEPPEFGAEHRARNALGRLPSVDDVAGAVVFLASPLADAITGAQIPVSCGSPMHVG
jgi:3-oxoacyl-[acyl-carrier protein] reductase